jgi:Ca2+-binding EF-hand superfamily protein
MEVLDENKDGVLSSDEIENAGVALRKLDKNKDGKLSQAEMGRPRFGRGRFGGFDRPGRGLRRPRGGFRGPRGRPRPGGDSIGAPPARPDLRRINVESLLARFDKNKDGKLQKDELPGFLWKRFSPADEDGDGAITKQEFASLQKQASQDKESRTVAKPSTENENSP